MPRDLAEQHALADRVAQNRRVSIPAIDQARPGLDVLGGRTDHRLECQRDFAIPGRDRVGRPLDQLDPFAHAIADHERDHELRDSRRALAEALVEHGELVGPLEHGRFRGH